MIKRIKSWWWWNTYGVEGKDVSRTKKYAHLIKSIIATIYWKPLLIVLSVIALILVVSWGIFKGYSLAWTGFGDFIQPDGKFERGKTLWDWMQLLIIPIFLAIGVFLLNRFDRERESLRAEEHSKLEREIATDRQQEAALQSYLDRMADLLLKEKLRTTHNEEVRDVARIRTLSLLRGLDGKRKGLVLLFLKESRLIANEPEPIVSLAEADLRKAFLVQTNLSKANLSKTNLREAELFETDLRGTDLREANLIGANLHGADLMEADFKGADLRSANLGQAKVYGDQLDAACSLEGATMPDGSIGKGPGFFDE